jgi:hypothetical protein
MAVDQGVSEVTGWLLAFGIITLAASIIFVTTSPYISSTLMESRIKISEIQMTLLDYATSKSALGDTPSQILSFNLNGGSLNIESGGNNLTIWAVFNGSEEKVIYSSSIGRVTVKLGDVLIGYEGGGVWEKRGKGVVMLSPPEFHYKVDTLTLPIVKIASRASAAGDGVIEMGVKKDGLKVVYPNASLDSRFINPLKCDYLKIQINSEFWQGWKKYFEERSDAEVTTVDEENNTIIAVMAVKSAPVSKVYGLPIRISRLNTTDEEPINEFEINFVGLSSNFDLIWRTNTDPELLILMKKTQGGGYNHFEVAVVYGNDTWYESWQTTDGFDWDIGSDTYTLDLLSADANMTYQKPQGFTSPTGFSFSSQPVDPTITWGTNVNVTDSGDFSVATKTLREVIEHYFRVLAIQTSPDIVIDEDPKTPASQGFNEQLTTYRLFVDQQPPIITYLHVIEHTIEIFI